MNAYGYYLDLIEEESPAPVATAPQPEQIPSEYPESDAARAWFNALDIPEPAAEETNSETAKFYNYDVVIHAHINTHSNKVQFGFYTRSPQQRTAGQYSATTYGYADSVNELQSYLDRFLAERETVKKRADARRDAKRAARSKFENPYKVGDILTGSWGYDQTNVDFFQIVDVRPTSLKIQEIKCESTGATGYDSCDVSALKDEFITEKNGDPTPPAWVTIQVYKDGSHGIPSPIHGNLHKWDGTPKYCSWGH